MKFKIKRASLYSHEKPCKNAKMMQFPVYDIRVFSSPEEFNKKLGKKYGNWEDTGTNHRVENGMIIRDLPPLLKIGELKSTRLRIY